MNDLDSSKRTVLGFLKQLHFKHVVAFYVEQDLLERLTDCINGNFFFFMSAFDSYKILRDGLESSICKLNCPFFCLSVLFAVPGRRR